jgi:hypothetical protein
MNSDGRCLRGSVARIWIWLTSAVSCVMRWMAHALILYSVAFAEAQTEPPVLFIRPPSCHDRAASW